MYGTFTTTRGEQYIVRLEDVAFISMDESCRDYRAYLAWLEEGNTPDEWQAE